MKIRVKKEKKNRKNFLAVTAVTTVTASCACAVRPAKRPRGARVPPRERSAVKTAAGRGWLWPWNFFFFPPRVRALAFSFRFFFRFGFLFSVFRFRFLSARKTRPRARARVNGQAYIIYVLYTRTAERVNAANITRIIVSCCCFSCFFRRLFVFGTVVCAVRSRVRVPVRVQRRACTKRISPGPDDDDHRAAEVHNAKTKGRKYILRNTFFFSFSGCVLFYFFFPYRPYYKNK